MTAPGRATAAVVFLLFTTYHAFPGAEAFTGRAVEAAVNEAVWRIQGPGRQAREKAILEIEAQFASRISKASLEQQGKALVLSTRWPHERRWIERPFLDLATDDSANFNEAREEYAVALERTHQIQEERRVAINVASGEARARYAPLERLSVWLVFMMFATAILVVVRMWICHLIGWKGCKPPAAWQAAQKAKGERRKQAVKDWFGL